MDVFRYMMMYIMTVMV